MPTRAFALLVAVSLAASLGCITETRVVRSKRPGSVEGRVTLEGAAPSRWLIGETAVVWPGLRKTPPMEWDGTPPHAIGVSPTGGVRGVAVWLETAGWEAPGHETSPPDIQKKGEVTFRLEGSCFWPMIGVLPAGGAVRFENADARSHHVQFLGGSDPLDVFVDAGATAELRLRDPGRFRLSCNDHAFMRADLIVAPGAWSAVTDARGRFLIEDVPSGHYEVRFGHHRLGELDPPPVAIIGGGGRAFVELRAKIERWKY